MESELVHQLEEATRKYWLGYALDWLTGPSLAEQLGFFSTPPRYMETSKPQVHEFGEADGKAVMRRFRHGGAVSPALLQRAMKALTDAAYERGYDEGADANY